MVGCQRSSAHRDEGAEEHQLQQAHQLAVEHGGGAAGAQPPGEHTLHDRTHV